MLSKKLLDEMNEQIKHELFSAYLYQAMSSYCAETNLPGFAHWMGVQAREEISHAMKFVEYIHDRGGKVVYQAIDQPPAEFNGPTALFASALKHEQKVTARINLLYAIAVEDKDYASQTFLSWFVTEQVEEEKNATQILETLKAIGEKGTALFMLDRQLGSREG